jgi:hypothetical protein
LDEWWNARDGRAFSFVARKKFKRYLEIGVCSSKLILVRCSILDGFIGQQGLLAEAIGDRATHQN